MRKLSRVPVLLAVTSLLPVACKSGFDLEPTFAFAHGTVTDTAGMGVSAASVILEVTRLGDSVPRGLEPTTTNAAGEYGVLLAIFTAPFDGTLDVRVTAAAVDSLMPAEVTGVPIRFDIASVGRDSVRVNVELSPSN